MKTTFLNGDNELKSRGLNYLLSRSEDFRFFQLYSHCENLEDLREELRNEDLTFSEIRQALSKFDELGSFYDYGLCFDFVDAGTFDNSEGYYRYQLSWGGPSDEIRFYNDGTIECVFLDWFVGVGFDVSGEDWSEWLLYWFTDVGSIDWNSLEPEQIEIYE